MLFTGYQLGSHLLNSTLVAALFDRKKTVRDQESLRVVERDLAGIQQTRNSVFEVTGYVSGHSEKVTYLAKQARFNEATYLSSIRNEAYVLELFRAARLPKLNAFVGYDRYQYLLFQRKFAGKPPVWNSAPSPATQKAFYEKLAPVLATAHAITHKKVASKGWPNRFGYRKPLLMVQTVRDLEDLLAGTPTPQQADVSNQLLADGAKLLNKLKHLTWNDDALIHFDLKSEHILLAPDGEIEGLIDWEMADMGDVHWDLASAWYIVLHYFMIGNRNAETEFGNSIEPFNHFLSHYTFYRAINPVRLQQFLGLVILQQHYFGLLQRIGFSSISEEKIPRWLDLAKRLLMKPDKESGLIVPNVPNQPPLPPIWLRAPRKPTRRQCVNAQSHKGTMLDLDELAAKLVEDRTKIGLGKDQLPLETYIYRWYTGNLGKQDNPARKGRAAETPDAEKIQFNEDLWWRVEGASKTGQLVIRKESCRRMAQPGTFVYLSHDARNAKKGRHSYVKRLFPHFIVRPNDGKESSDDLWVNGQRLLAQDSANWTRFYYNLEGKIDGINLFIELISTKLNERQIPFQLKLRNALASYTRTDSAILFLHRQHVLAALDAITYTYRRLADAGFIDTKASPHFTKKVKGFGGLSYGDNPAEAMQSFGTARAQLIAEAVGPYFEPTAQQSKPRDEFHLKGQMIDALAIAGYNVFELYRNPFPKAGEFKHRIDKLAWRLRKPALLDVGLGAALAFMPQQRFLKAARDIGFVICREAIWYGNRCTWFCFKKMADGNVGFETASEADRLGIALFLGQLAKICPYERMFEECFRGCLTGRWQKLDAALKTVQHKLANQRVAVSEIKESITYKVLQSVLFQKVTHRPLMLKMPLADMLLAKYVDSRMPFPHGYIQSTNEVAHTEFNPTLTHGLAALGYFFLLFLDNIDTPIVELADVYDVTALPPNLGTDTIYLA
ncbi:phosphotransferase [Fibrella sp. WM1]|uniref:phosphotransferase n=1 Tax=Fibrella musci TaxID=3242485 RepID=UPI0035215287